MKGESESIYGEFTGHTAEFNLLALSDMVYDFMEEMGLEVTYLRWYKENQKFNVSFEGAKDEDDWKKTREMCS